MRGSSGVTGHLHSEGPGERGSMRGGASPVCDIYGQVESLAVQVAQDELAVKRLLSREIQRGNTELVLKVLADWCSRPPRDILEAYLEVGDGNRQ